MERSYRETILLTFKNPRNYQLNDICTSQKCFAIWGHNNERIEKLQKRSIRFITQSKYLAHMNQFFIKLDLLKIQDIFKLHQLKFYYKNLIKSLPNYFQNLNFTRQSRYNTIRCDDLTPMKVNHVFATKCISHNIPNLINRLPNEIRDKFHTHIFSGFVLYTRKYHINMYQPQ